MSLSIDPSKIYILDHQNGHFREATLCEKKNSDLDIVARDIGKDITIQVLEKRHVTVESKATVFGFVLDLLGIEGTRAKMDTARAFHDIL